MSDPFAERIVPTTDVVAGHRDPGRREKAASCVRRRSWSRFRRSFARMWTPPIGATAQYDTAPAARYARPRLDLPWKLEPCETDYCPDADFSRRAWVAGLSLDLQTYG